MFNLGNLITSCMLATGVATTTPVNHAVKKAPTNLQNQVIEQDYTLPINSTYTAFTETTLTQINNMATGSIYSVFNDGRDAETKYNLQGNNSYLNVIGNIYNQEIYTIFQNTEILFVQTEYNLNGNYDNVRDKTSKVMICLQITPYMFNKDTDLTIELAMPFTNVVDTTIYAGQMTFDITKLSMIRNVYSSTQLEWANYIGRQNQSLQVTTIHNDIEDLNNEFYYTKKQTLINNFNDYETDEIEINITSNTANYIFIEYIPFIDWEWYAEPTGGTPYTIDPDNIEGLRSGWIQRGANLSIGSIKIKGTNIIPNGDYEVIDLPGLMWEILTMPFAFVSQAFNLTLFPGTPYQLNISNLFLSIIAVCVFVWLITFFLKMKG